MTIQWSEACDSFAAHGDDDFAAVGDMSDVAAEVVVELAHAHLVFEISLWRHRAEYKHHNGPGGSGPLAVARASSISSRDCSSAIIRHRRR